MSFRFDFNVVKKLYSLIRKQNKFRCPGTFRSDNFKRTFGILEFSQKNEFVVIVKTNSFDHFLGEFQDTKSPFEII